MDVGFDLRGVARATRRLTAMQGAVRRAAQHALVIEAETIMAEAKRETPVDTGTLRASGRVSPPSMSLGNVSIDLTFGGPAREYAIYVHEDLNATHVNGNAKFLEGPVKRHADRFSANVSRSISAALRSL